MIYENKEFTSLTKSNTTYKAIEFYNCSFTNCTFQECDIINCLFRQCTFTTCKIINNQFKQSKSTDNAFHECTILGINWSTLINDNYLYYPFTTLKECILKYNVFYNMKLQKFDFSNSDLTGSIIEECDLKESTFENTILKDTLFAKNNLLRSNFRKATSYYIDPLNNNIKKAKFSFPEAMNLLAAFEIEID